jgi:hypothetical protein
LWKSENSELHCRGSEIKAVAEAKIEHLPTLLRRLKFSASADVWNLHCHEQLSRKN